MSSKNGSKATGTAVLVMLKSCVMKVLTISRTARTVMMKSQLMHQLAVPPQRLEVRRLLQLSLRLLVQRLLPRHLDQARRPEVDLALLQEVDPNQRLEVRRHLDLALLQEADPLRRPDLDPLRHPDLELLRRPDLEHLRRQQQSRHLKSPRPQQWSRLHLVLRAAIDQYADFVECTIVNIGSCMSCDRSSPGLVAREGCDEFEEWIERNTDCCIGEARDLCNERLSDFEDCKNCGVEEPTPTPTPVVEPNDSSTY